jgi:hypothetical protein
MVNISIINRLVGLTLFLASFICFQASGHILKGKVSDINGDPIPYATIFVKELSMGTTTNIDGIFEIEVPAGLYTLNFRRIGYIPKTEAVEVKTTILELTIILEEYVHHIKEVKVLGTGEDPAYPIMRKAIGLASYHQNIVESYTANLYLRGTVKIDKVPGIIRGHLRRHDIPVKSGDIFVDETVSKVTFKAPDKYHQEVTTLNTTFPEAIDVSIVEFFGSSLYLDRVDMWVSPLARNAFAHYYYAYEDYEIEGKYTISKIKVTPKRKSKQLFKGYIYIIDNLWCIHSAELTFRNPYGEITAKQVFDEVAPTIWLPVSYHFFAVGGYIGVKGTVKIGGSVKYVDLKPNYKLIALKGESPYVVEIEETKEDITPESKKSTKRERVRKEKVEKILTKGEIDNRDMHRLSKFIEEEAISNRKDTVKSLELKEKATRNIQKGAEMHDSAHWAEIRAIPLTSIEIKSFNKRDSLIIATGGKSHYVVTPIKKKKKNLSDLSEIVFFGKNYQNRDTTLFTHYRGLINANSIGFNVVDGWHYSQEATFRKILSKKKDITFTPRISWAFSRKTFLWSNRTTLNYSPYKRGLFILDFGKFTKDFNTLYGIDPLLNAISSILIRENYARFFEDRFIDVFNRIDLSNGLTLYTGFGCHSYKRLENTTNWPGFNSQYLYYPNIPNNDEITDKSLNNQKSSTLKLKLEYTPRYFFYIRKGKKVMSHSSFPTYWIGYTKGIKNLFGSDSDFDYLETGLKQKISAAPSTSVHYEFRAGWFLNNNQIHFSEFTHTNTQSIGLLLKEHRHAWSLPDYYQLATSNYFVEGHISLKAPYIALKYLPLVRNTTWRETVRFSLYSKPGYTNYFEAGYSLSEILLTADIGIFIGWKNWDFYKIGINMVIRLSK